jgi:hypothetical protein
MDRTTVGRNILPLERDGLIRIEPAANDLRTKELHLTKVVRSASGPQRKVGQRRRYDLKPLSGRRGPRICAQCCGPWLLPNSRLPDV